jgi:hypothetical protein
MDEANCRPFITLLISRPRRSHTRCRTGAAGPHLSRPVPPSCPPGRGDGIVAIRIRAGTAVAQNP